LRLRLALQYKFLPQETLQSRFKVDFGDFIDICVLQILSYARYSTLNCSATGKPSLQSLKNTRPTTYVLSLCGIAFCFAIAFKLVREGKSTAEVISAVGSVASFVGLLIALLQIRSVKEISEATQAAVTETKAQLIGNISISDLSKAVKLIEQVQTYLGYNKFDLAYLRMLDLRILLIQFGGNPRFLGTTGRTKYEGLLQNIGIHVINLFDAAFRAKIIRIAVVNQTLENAVGILVAFENELKFGGGIK